MITLYVGGLGSSKTANAVRGIMNDKSGLKTYTNIILKVKNNKCIFKHPKTIIKTEIVQDEKGKDKIKYSFNSDEWLKLPKPMNIIWDEAHFIADSRNSQLSQNKVTTEFVSMARRVIGFDKYGSGDFIFIVQDAGTLDIRIRDLTTTVILHELYFWNTCQTCKYRFFWNSKKPNVKFCTKCGLRTLVKSGFISKRYFFTSIELYHKFKYGREKTYYYRDRIKHIDDYFKCYDTLQYIKLD